MAEQARQPGKRVQARGSALQEEEMEGRHLVFPDRRPAPLTRAVPESARP